MNNTLNNARDEAKRIANEVRVEAEKARQGIGAKIFSSSNKKIGNFDYISLIHKIRTAHLVILVLQAIGLYAHADDIGVTLFLVPLLLILGTGYIVGKRWYNRTDGRHDIYQLANQKNPSIKAQYALGLFGSFILALLTHFISPSLNICFTSLIYNLTKYLSIVAGGTASGLEVYEGVKGKFH